MPKIKTDRYGSGSLQQPFAGKGLRSNQGTVYETPFSDREKEECFDMYRSDGRSRFLPERRPNKERIARRPAAENGFQLWQIACLITALGAFCIFADSLLINLAGIPVRMMSFEILSNNGSLSGQIPQCAIYMSAVPIAFMAMFGVFAYLKEDAFEKAYLALIAVAIFITSVMLYWCGQMQNYGTEYLLSFSPGNAVIIEIGCSIALVIVIVCQRIIGHIGSKPSLSLGWPR